MREMGVRFVRIGEFAWSRIEPEPGRFEFGWLRRAMDVLTRADLKIALGTRKTRQSAPLTNFVKLKSTVELFQQL